MAPLILAHRAAAPGAPENSLEGIRRSTTVGADGVEIDVRRTLDGATVLLHDHSLWRAARCPGPVRLMPSAMVRRCRLANGETPCTLAEALAALPPSAVVAIDVKHESAAGEVLTQLGQSGCADRSLLWSSHVDAVRVLAAGAPEVETALLRDTTGRREHLQLLDDAHRLGARAVSARWEAVDEWFVREAHDRSLRVYAGCPAPNRHAEKAALLDGMTTDWPDLARRSIDALSADDGPCGS
jgi:glycerophosphoryl diester phosphodiesterase